MDYSLVITNYNKAAFIDRAVRSCLNQYLLRKKVEVIVVDDCSTDDSKVVLKEYENNISFIQLGENRGVAHASNVGLEKSHAPYWMRVDADDYLSAEACFHMGAILENNLEYDFVYCDHIRIDLRGLKQEYVRLDTERKLFEHGAGIMFRKERLIEVGGYDESLRNAEDYDLLLRLRESGSKGFYLPVPLYRYYIHGGNMTLSDQRALYWEKVNEKHGI
jgi:glycosyltransferase involved in cell wall biosynthesis